MASVQAFAPGRVNLIGEHTDYNGGLCLPFALERGVTVTATPVGGDEIEAHALDLEQRDRFPLAEDLRPRPESAPAREDWRCFVRGAVAELRRAGVEPRACRLEIAGDVPRGSGLSSSAALSVSLCLALCALAGAEPPERVALARLCSRIENDWCGARTGLLDQLASLHGEAGHAVRLDMHSLEARPVALDLGEHALVTLDSGAARSLAGSGSGYNARREESRRAAAALGVESLRELDPDPAAEPPDLRSRLEELTPVLRRRVRHLLSENRRVELAVRALERADHAELGRLLDASHASLRDDYDVSVTEVERTVETCKRAGALGARIVGGGFGGSVLALFGPGAEPPEGAVRVKPGPGARVG